MKPCRCGSGLPGRELNDAAGVLCVDLVCDACEPKEREQFDQRIFNPDSRYARTANLDDLEPADA
jgi:hypothetical protein